MPSFFGITDEESSLSETSNGIDDTHEDLRGKSQNTGNGPRVQGTRGVLTRMSSGVIPSQLPNFDSQQHSNVFMLALMQEHCKIKAWKILNKNRSPADQLSEDDDEVQALAEQLYAKYSGRVGGSHDLPEHVVGPGGADVRSLYTTHFDNMLEKEAEKILQGIESSGSIEELAGTSISAMDIPSSIPRDMGHSLLMKSSPENDLFGSTPKALFGPSSSSYMSSKSVYATEYEEICLLGRGGYGSVYKARNHLDNQLYAVKKILITSHRLQKSRETDQIEALLAELRTLAKLHHTNIVRYYHGWIETSYNTKHGTSANGPKLLEDLSSSQRLTRSSITDEVRIQDLDLTTDELNETYPEDSLDKHVTKYDEADDGIIFGFSSDHDSSSHARPRRPSYATTGSSSTQKMSMISVGEDDGEDEDPEVETIPRNFTSNDTPSSKRTPSNPLSPARMRRQTQYLGPDITLCIKMSLHPTTLSNYLSPDPPKNTDLPEQKHCFHQPIAVEILLSILDGVQYLHSQKIVHRDLKPANIFLSVDSATRPFLSGCVDITSCPECQRSRHHTTSTSAKPVWITPCIGDFGLIAEIKDSSSEETSSAATATTTADRYQPSALSALQPKPVGTQFYRPSLMPTTEPIICQKLDVYALGVIALELVYRFTTRAERMTVLSDLGRGVLPREFEGHKMAGGVLKMVAPRREERWGCEEVREWLVGLRG